MEQTDGYKDSITTAFMDGYNSNITLSKVELSLIPEFKKLRSLESANRHFEMFAAGEIEINPNLINYWARITRE